MRKEPRFEVSIQEDGDKAISAYLVWVYPHERVPKGARVVFFRANRERRLVCYVHHEAPSSEVSAFNGEDYLCGIAQGAIERRCGVVFTEEYDVFSDFGEW